MAMQTKQKINEKLSELVKLNEIKKQLEDWWEDALGEGGAIVQAVIIAGRYGEEGRDRLKDIIHGDDKAELAAFENALRLRPIVEKMVEAWVEGLVAAAIKGLGKK